MVTIVNGPAEPLLFREHDSFLHRTSPFTKLCFAAVMIAAAFWGQDDYLREIIFIGVILPVSFSGKIAKCFLITLAKVVLPFSFFLFLVYGLLPCDGKSEIIIFNFFPICPNGIERAYCVVSKVMIMIASFLLLLMTTSSSSLMRDLESRGLPHSICYIFLTSLTLIPRMKAKASTIADSQRSRGLDTDGGIISRVRGVCPLVIPLVLGALSEVEERALALEIRGYNSNRVKTSLLWHKEKRWEACFRGICLTLIVVLAINKLWHLFV